MRLLLVFSILNLSGSAAYSQYIPDSLLYTKQVLNLEFLTKAAEFQNGKSDFLMVRINDSLSDDNHSYSCYYNKDSCTKGFTTRIDTNRNEAGSRYNLVNGGIGISPANLRSTCVNFISDEEDQAKIASVQSKPGVFVKHADLMANDYVLFARIGDKTIYEVFSREEFIANAESDFFSYVSRFIFIWVE